MIEMKLACIHTCMRACVHACVRACVCVCACMRACMCMCVCTHACVRACVRAYVWDINWLQSESCERNKRRPLKWLIETLWNTTECVLLGVFMNMKHLNSYNLYLNPPKRWDSVIFHYWHMIRGIVNCANKNVLMFRNHYAFSCS